MATCSKHNGQPYVMVCYSCDRSYRFVCCVCIAKTHKGHELETFETAAHNVLERFRKEKANSSSNLKECHVELKNYATLQENERKISENRKQYIHRRRELLKLAIDEAAEILLQKDESSDQRIMDVLTSGKQHTEDQVRNILEFQNLFALLQNSTDYQQVIRSGKQMCFPNISKNHFLIPAVTRHTLMRTFTIDRKLVREMFGEEVEQDIRGSYLSHCFDGKEESDTDSVATTDLFAEATEHLEDATDSKDPDSDGNVGSSWTRRQLNKPNASQRQETPHISLCKTPPLLTPNYNPMIRSHNIVPSMLNPESKQERQVSVERKCGDTYPNAFEETAASALPPDQKPGHASATCASVYETKTIRFLGENRGPVSMTRTLDHPDVKRRQSKYSIHSGTSQEHYV